MRNATRLPIADDDRLRAVIDAFRRGDGALTALGLYYELERTTPLIELHTMLRDGPRNRAENGLQQSYGDHNRLLMLGLDKLVAGDLDWYRGRVDPDDPVADADLAEVLHTVTSLDLTRDALVALWLAGALHDCGMLAGRSATVDVEDGVVIGREIIDALCPADLRDLAVFALRHHDYIKDVCLGEVPVTLVTDDLDELDVALRPLALGALGLVQVAGAASLGVGRLSAFRVRIFHRCLDGTVLEDGSRANRLRRLLAPVPEMVDGDRLDPALGAEPANGEAMTRLLDRVPVHRWHRVAAGVDDHRRLELLSGISAAWERSGAERVVLSGPDLAEPGRIETALNGTRLLVIGA